jgi:glycosyltransferase involved in cell wall biosynthesis
MRVGVTLYLGTPISPVELDSIKHVATSMTEAIAARHEVVFLPPAYSYASRRDAVGMCEEFVQNSDVIVGCPSGQLLSIRQRLGRNVPMAGLLLGVLPRGGWGFDVQVPFLNTNDILVPNCTADQELLDKFVVNASSRVLPFAYDDKTYYAVDEAERASLRQRLGFRPEDRLLVYIGRITLQKNVHTLLKVFSAVQKVVPDACLVIAGPTVEHGSPEFGITPVNLAGTVKRLIAKLQIPEDRIQMFGNLHPDSLRMLYNLAEVKVNMTLHHDENFGLSQVEAMACGAPVVGTAWGGLKDTVVDGVSGYKVSTSVTPMGIKANWWEAVNRIVAILRDPAERERLRESSVRHAVENYSHARHQATLLEILDAMKEGSERPAEPLQTSEFGKEFWGGAGRAPHLRGERSYELYQELMHPITAPSAQLVPHGEALDAGQVVCLAAPVTDGENGTCVIDDPMYPFDLEVPRAHRGAFGAVLAALREEPAMTVERLSGALADHPGAAGTLAWMLETGLLLRTAPVEGWVAPGEIDRRLSEPLFRIRRLEKDTDFVVY